MSKSPNLDAFMPPKLKGSLGTGTNKINNDFFLNNKPPMLTPSIPALKRFVNHSAVDPVVVYIPK